MSLALQAGDRHRYSASTGDEDAAYDTCCDGTETLRDCAKCWPVEELNVRWYPTSRRRQHDTNNVNLDTKLTFSKSLQLNSSTSRVSFIVYFVNPAPENAAPCLLAGICKVPFHFLDFLRLRALAAHLHALSIIISEMLVCVLLSCLRHYPVFYPGPSCHALQPSHFCH